MRKSSRATRVIERRPRHEVVWLLGPSNEFSVSGREMRNAFQTFALVHDGSKQFLPGWCDSVQLAANAILHIADQCKFACEVSDSRIRMAIARHCGMPWPEADLPVGAILAARELTYDPKPTAKEKHDAPDPAAMRACVCSHGKLTAPFLLLKRRQK